MGRLRGDTVRCIRGGEGEHGATLAPGAIYVVDRDQHPALDTIWIKGAGRWKAARFVPAGR